VSFPTDKSFTTYSLAQVNVSTRVVLWRTTFPSSQRAQLLGQTAGRPGTFISIRFPPPPPPPEGDGWDVASQLLTMASGALATGSVQAEQPPQ
jgi:hypothetical protein